MGKNYYGYKKLSPEEKIEAINLIESDKYYLLPKLTVFHIGKASAGWKFLFNSQDWQYFNNKEEFVDFLKSLIIKDQYEELYSYEQFMEEVEKKRKNDNWSGEIHFGFNFSKSLEFS